MLAGIANRPKTMLTPEWHAHSRDRIQSGEASNGFLRVPHIPQSHLTIAHLGESSCDNAIMFAHPGYSAVLCASVSWDLMGRPLLSNVPYAQLLVSRGGHEHAAIRAP